MKYINEYLEYLKYQKSYSEHTILSYSRSVISFFEYFDGTNLLEISYDDIKKYLKHLDNLKLSKASICNEISALKGLYKYMLHKRYIDTNPFILVSLPKKDQKLPSFIYYDELETILHIPDLNDKLGIRDRLILELLYATGIRVSELINIKMKDINFDKQEIKVTGKGAKERIVYYGDYAKEHLKLYLNNSRDILNINNSEYLILNARGNKITSRGITSIIDKIIKLTCIKNKVSPHTFRHTFATHLLNEGCDILTVQELLGHESLKATQIYTHVTNERLKEVYFKAHNRNRKIPKDSNLQ